MKPRRSNQKNAAMTLVEVLVVIVVLAILVAMLLPALARAKRHSGPNCLTHLKQIGLAYRLWAGDHNDKYPMQVSVTNGGVAELIATGNVAAVFQVMSNELGTPKILVCPNDDSRTAATNFTTDFNNSRISYFVGLDVTNETNPQMLLSGDDNFLFNGAPIKSGLFEVTSNAPFAWNDTLHFDVRKNGWFSRTKIGYGNLLMADGSVQIIYQDGLRQAFQQSSFTNRLAIP